ncbi:hypothetical protein ACIRLA_46525 [Streptomyces sp. NPDC102364]|uniref:hypothetical protein n=1 Tax=Streptomyces sp. NPDC102364 TaxID=3366161 RepID=UPI003818691F
MRSRAPGIAALAVLVAVGFAAETPPPDRTTPAGDHSPAPQDSPKPLRSVPGEPAWTHTCTGGPDDYNCPEGDERP